MALQMFYRMAIGWSFSLSSPSLPSGMVLVMASSSPVARHGRRRLRCPLAATPLGRLDPLMQLRPRVTCQAPIRHAHRRSSPGSVDPAQGDSQYAPAPVSGKADQDELIHVQSDGSERDGTSSVDTDSSAETVGSSDCDPQEPEAAPVVVAPGVAAVLASPHVAQVVLDDLHAPLVTIKLDELALALAVPLLRVPYLERLLEAVRSGTPAEGLADALRPAADRHMMTWPLTSRSSC